MESDIKKIIEEYRQELKESLLNYTDLEIHIAIDGFKKCLSKWQEAERWRKVEEELPEVSNYKDLKCNFLAKTDYGYDIVTYYNDPKFLVGWFANAIRRNVIEWKPIS